VFFPARGYAYTEANDRLAVGSQTADNCIHKASPDSTRTREPGKPKREFVRADGARGEEQYLCCADFVPRAFEPVARSARAGYVSKKCISFVLGPKVGHTQEQFL
jgi:hypothetical protein